MEENIKKQKEKQAKLIVCLGILFSSTAVILIRWSTAPSLVLAAYRKTLVTLILLPMILVRYRGELRSLTPKKLLWCGLSGAFLALHFYSYFEGVQNTKIASSQVLAGSEVIFVALAMWASGKEKMSVRCICGIVIAMGGSLLVSLGRSGGGDNIFYGNMMSILAAFSLAVYSLIGTSQRKDTSNTVYTFLVYGSAAILLNIMVGVSGYSYTGYGTVNFLCALGMAVFNSLLGHSIFNWSFKYLSPTLVAMYKIFLPVLAALWAFFLFAEVPLWNQIVGGIVVMGGIALYTASKGVRK